MDKIDFSLYLDFSHILGCLNGQRVYIGGSFDGDLWYNSKSEFVRAVEDNGGVIVDDLRGSNDVFIAAMPKDLSRWLKNDQSEYKLVTFSCVHMSIAMSKELPYIPLDNGLYHPIFFRFLDDRNICPCGYTEQQIENFKMLIHTMNGQYTPYYEEHLPNFIFIMPDARNPHYMMYKNNKNVQIIHHDWLLKLLEENESIDYNPYIIKCFQGMSVLLIGFDDIETEEIRSKIESNGGTIKIEKDKDCTHVIVAQQDALSQDDRIFFKKHQIEVKGPEWLGETLNIDITPDSTFDKKQNTPMDSQVSISSQNLYKSFSKTVPSFFESLINTLSEDRIFEPKTKFFLHSSLEGTYRDRNEKLIHDELKGKVTNILVDAMYMVVGTKFKQEELSYEEISIIKRKGICVLKSGYLKYASYKMDMENYWIDIDYPKKTEKYTPFRPPLKPPSKISTNQRQKKIRTEWADDPDDPIEDISGSLRKRKRDKDKSHRVKKKRKIIPKPKERHTLPLDVMIIPSTQVPEKKEIIRKTPIPKVEEPVIAEIEKPCIICPDSYDDTLDIPSTLEAPPKKVVRTVSPIRSPKKVIRSQSVSPKKSIIERPLSPNPYKNVLVRSPEKSPPFLSESFSLSSDEDPPMIISMEPNEGPPGVIVSFKCSPSSPLNSLLKVYFGNKLADIKSRDSLNEFKVIAPRQDMSEYNTVSLSPYLILGKYLDQQ
eukprot:TRINITY_DN11667_c0_g1_i1.p1 TRINITY_DN11667_c0_g1~~TRINITY_DN11667_c0_g1_i1.p1  ORF type:complete len:711 (+),score=138.23 TRINITY_DN11667_c0_g1_i1:112-2244(+)